MIETSSRILGNASRKKKKRSNLKTDFLILVLSCILASFPVNAFELRFQNLNEISFSKTSQSDIRKFAEDKRGFVWIATAAGLLRFDGVRTDIYSDFSAERHIIHSNVQDVKIGTNGEVFILHKSGVEKSDDGIVFKPLINFSQSLKSNTPTSFFQILITNSNEIILVNSRGIVWFDQNGKKSQQLPLPQVNSNHFISKLIAKNGRYFVATTHGLWTFEASGDNWYQLEDWPEKLKNKNIFTIHSSKYSNSLLVSEHDNVFIINLDDNSLKASYENVSLGIKYPVLQIVESDNGTYWAATTNGLLQISDEWKKIQRHNLSAMLNMESTLINDLFMDHENNLWIGSAYDGVRFLNRNSIAFRKVRPDTPFKSRNISALSSSSDSLWIGSRQGEIVKLNPKTNEQKVVPLGSEQWGMVAPPINDILPINNKLWITTGAGLFVKDLAKNETDLWIFGQKEDFPLLAITSIYEDPTGKIWMTGARNSIVVFNSQKETASNIDELAFENLQNSPYWQEQYDELNFLSVTGSKSWLYFGTTDGRVLALEQDSNQFRLFQSNATLNQSIHKMLVDKSNQLWMLTDNAVVVFDPSLNQTKNVLRFRDFNQNGFYDFIFDEDDNVWFAGSNAIAKLNLNSGEKEVFGSNQGTFDKEYNQATTKINQKYYFGSVGGLIELTPQMLSTIVDQQSVRFNDITLSSLKGSSTKLFSKNSSDELFIKIEDGQNITIPLYPAIRSARSSFDVGVKYGDNPVIALENWQINLHSYQFNVGTHSLTVMLKNKLDDRWFPQANLNLDRVGLVWESSAFKIALYVLLLIGLVVSVATWYTSRARVSRKVNKELSLLTLSQSRKYSRLNQFGIYSYFLANKLSRITRTSKNGIEASINELNNISDSLIQFGYQLNKQRLSVVNVDLHSTMENHLDRYLDAKIKQQKISIQSDSSVTAEIFIEYFNVYLRTFLLLVRDNNCRTATINLTRKSARRVCLEVNVYTVKNTTLKQTIPLQLLSLMKLLAKQAGYNFEFGDFGNRYELSLTIPVNQKWRGIFSKGKINEVEKATFAAPPESSNLNLIESHEATTINVVGIGLSKIYKSQLSYSYPKEVHLSFTKTSSDLQIENKDKTFIIINVDNSDPENLTQLEHLKFQNKQITVILICPMSLVEHYEEQTRKFTSLVVLSSVIETENLWQIIFFLDKNIDASTRNVRIGKAADGNAESPKLDTTNDKLIPFIVQLDELLEKEYVNSALTVELLADRMYLSKSQFTRKLRQALNITPVEYIKSYRLKKALTLLEQGQNINLIAKRVGFASQSYFATCFKKEYGYSPSQHQIPLK